MKFNMGCGNKILEGWINVDKEMPEDSFLGERWSLEELPWRWLGDNIADEILFNHSLEHMGQSPEIFLNIIKETYRIAKPGCIVQINVPHPRSDDYLNDPTHVRPIMPGTLHLFDKQLCERWQKEGASNTPLALICNIDFEMLECKSIVAYDVSKLQSYGLEAFDPNYIKEFRMTLRVRK